MQVQDLLQHFEPSVYVSLALLFGIAAQFKAMDGYAFLRRVLASLETRVGVLYAVVILTSLFSPLILNDVLVLILTPVVIRYSKQYNVDVAPLVVAEITFTNIASSVTPLGNPQNILLWQTSGIAATGFVAGTALRLTLAGLVSAALLYPLSRGTRGPREPPMTSPAPLLPAVYLLVVIIAIFSSAFLDVSSVDALSFSFFIGFAFTFRTLLRVANEFDLRSLAILYLLVASVTLVALAIEPVAATYAAQAASGEQPFSAAFFLVVSSAISNVPATQLVIGLTAISAHAATTIAVEAGLAGNVDPISSFANILALLMVRRAGLPIRRAIVLQLVVGLVAFLVVFL